MKKETMLKAFTDIDDSFIAEAAPPGYLPKEKRGFRWLNAKMLAGAFAVLLLAAVMPRVLKPGEEGTPVNPGLTVVTPYTVCENMAEAEKITGFSLTCPETYKDMTMYEISVYNGTLIDVIYEDADEDITMRVRKAAGSDEISGDSNLYKAEKEISADGKTITARGEDAICHLLIWTEDGYSYAVMLSQGVSYDEAAEIAGTIH